jgi:hypothetical protein
MAGPGDACQFPTGFIDGSRYYRIDYAGPGRINGIEAKPYRCLAGYYAGPFNPGLNGILIVIGYNNFMRIISADFFVLMPAPKWLNLRSISSINKLLVHAENNKFRGPAYDRVGKSLHHYLRTNTGSIAHRYTYNQLVGYRIVAVVSIHHGKSKTQFF